MARTCVRLTLSAAARQLDFDGLGKLPPEAVTVEFDKRRVVVSIRTSADDGGVVRRLALSPLAHEIDVAASSHARKPAKLIVRLAKLDKSKTWFDLLSKKALADDE